jgi:hypothetical protein
VLLLGFFMFVSKVQAGRVSGAVRAPGPLFQAFSYYGIAVSFAFENWRIQP